MTDLDPSGIMAIATGYWRSKVLLSTVGLGLFSELAGGSLTRREIQGELGLQPRPAADFLDGLVSMGLLVRDGEGEGTRYGNTPETAHFLDRRSPAYIGGILELWEGRNFRFWADLTEALQTGRAQKRDQAVRAAVLRDAVRGSGAPRGVHERDDRGIDREFSAAREKIRSSATGP
jgi:Dimerisation domain